MSPDHSIKIKESYNIVGQEVRDAWRTRTTGLPKFEEEVEELEEVGEHDPKEVCRVILPW